MKTMKKTVQVTSQTVTTAKVSTNPFTLILGKVYPSIKAVGAACGVTVPPRKGSCFLDPTTKRVFLWCIHLGNHPLWNNTLSQDGNEIVEQKKTPIPFKKFWSDIRTKKYNDVEVLRICFAKDNKGYRFLGVYRIALVDIDKQIIVYRRVYLPLVAVKISTYRKRTIEIVESEETIVTSLI